MPKITNFNQQPNLPQLEESIQQFWATTKAFEHQVTQRPDNKAYVFYDGPPFATGMPHYGHLLASTIKDVIPRYWAMKGYHVKRVWGWDCHGLPIENMIEKKLDLKGGKKGIENLGIDVFNEACRAEVLRLDQEWEKIIGRLGRWVDFQHNYKTMDTTFMESVWWGFKQLYEKNLVYEGKKVILYCSRCATPLSNFEIAMDNSYQEVSEPSTTYKYKVVGETNTYLLAWSTTPWNKIATPALAVNPTLTYVRVQQGSEVLIVAQSRLSMLKAETPFKVVTEMTGNDLTSLQFEPHYDFFKADRTTEKIGVVVADEFVSDEDGTGIVTLAVYGEDDYRVMQREGVQLIEHVDDQGKIKPEVTPWAGLYILKVNPLVDADLSERGLIYEHRTHTHSVATCYRCGTRLYYTPLPAWFINIQALKPALLNHNESINWFPEHLKYGRFGKGLEQAPDWNISRSRYWGTPMPIWVGYDQNQKPVKRVIGSRDELKAWAVNPQELGELTDIHRQYLDTIEVWVDDAKTIKGTRIAEVFDCWVESGSMPFASVHYPFENKTFFDKNYPAQFVSEYIAQTRAWFYTMHVLSVGIFNKPPFENVLTTGTILAEDGSKMSKSKKNYPDPMGVINSYGSDSLRLYLMSSPVMKSENLNFNEKEVSDIRRKVFVIWWNVFAFYQQFADTSLDPRKVPTTLTHILDEWVISKLQTTIRIVTEELDQYNVIKASRTAMAFVDELSTWYLRLSRERVKNKNNQGVSQVFGHVLYTLAQLFAPITPFFPEVIHHTMVGEDSSIHHTDWPLAETYDSLVVPNLESDMEMLQKVVEKAHAERKNQNLKVRQPLSNLIIHSAYKWAFPDRLAELLMQEVNVKTITWQTSNDSEPVITLDTTLTSELIAEGQAREVVRQIQTLRRSNGLRVGQKAQVTLPSWPETWTDYIQTKTDTRLVQGENLKLEAE